MRRAGLPRSVALISICIAGCATVDNKLGDHAWYQKTREVSTKAADATKSVATRTYQRMQGYLARKDLLATFHDAGEHSEDAVLGILRKSGIAKSASPSQPASPGSKPKSPPPAAATPRSPRAPVAAPLNVPERYAGGLKWPVDAGIFSSEFGERWGKPHKGIDIAADVGEPVHAIADGEVIYAGSGLRGYGNVVILRHDRNMTSLYAHNSSLKVQQGDHVAQGELISLLGSTGHSTGPHVHFEIRQGDLAVNPRGVLPKPGFGQVAQNIDAEPRDSATSARLAAR